MTWAACVAILLSFVGKLGAFLQTIPPPVVGGLLILLFGNIIVIGLGLLHDAKEDFTEPRNMSIMSIILICGVGGMTFQSGSFTLKGVAWFQSSGYS